MANGAGYALTGDEGDLWGEAEEIIGLFTGPADRPRQVELIGCAPHGALRTAITSIGTDRALAGHADLSFLDSSGEVIGSYFVDDVTVRSVRPGGAPGQVDLTVQLSCGMALPGSELPWQLVRTGQLDRPGLWHDLDRTGRHAWLSVALTRQVHGTAPDQPARTTYRLDGRCVTDEDGFYCAIGEAVNGPGGYFGWNLDALVDCLRGGFGAETPFTLDWHSFETARALPRLDVILEILADGEVTVVPRPPAG